MTPQQLIAETVSRELQANAEALRALARDLVGAADAPDLVQETALRALRSPPAEPHGLAGWLRTTLRNLAGNHHRSNRRRRVRENVVARTAAQCGAPSAADLAERRDVLRGVTDRLWQLPEPYQRTLLWRYFESLTPTAIAAREGVPVATVKSRLQRGLALLRAECDRADGGRWRAVLPIACSAFPHAGRLAATLALLMTPTLKLFGSAVAVAATAALCLFLIDNDVEPPVVEEQSAVVPGPAASAVQRVEREPAMVSDAVGETAGPAPVLEHEHVFRLLCRVVDRDGLPIRGGQVVVGPRRGPHNVFGRTDQGGHVEIEWRGRRSKCEIGVGLVYQGHAQSLQYFRIVAGDQRRNEISLLAESGGDGAVCMAAVRAPSTNCTACHRGPSFPDVFERYRPAHAGLHPHSRFIDRLGITLRSGPNESFEEMGVYEVTSEEPPPPPPHLGRVTGRVFDDRGQPVGGATVIYRRETGGIAGRTRTLGDGTYEFEHLAPGKLVVRAGGGSSGIGEVDAAVVAGQVTTRDVTLARGLEITGRVVLPAGESPSGWRVEFESTRSAYRDAALVEPDGEFALANVPSGVVGQLLLWGPPRCRLPVAVTPSIRPGARDIVFDVALTGMPTGEIRVPLDPMRNDAVYVWHPESGRGAGAVRDAEGKCSLTGLAPGHYEVTVGQHDLGRHWIDGAGAIELSVAAVPATGVLVRGAGVPLGVELYLRQQDVDVRAAVYPDNWEKLQLPHGRWLAMWGEAEAPHVLEFSVGQREETVLTIAPTPR